MADVTIDSAALTGTARGCRSVVFTTADIGYWFFLDNTTGRLNYSKTTDGGATWGGQTEIATSTTLGFDVWFDQWTPGDSGTLIHMFWITSGEDDTYWRSLDTNGDTLGTLRTVFAGATYVAGRGVFVSGTKTRSGYLYCAYDGDAGAERGLHRSTDSGTTWSANLSTTFVEATIDQCLLFPASNTGDNNDCWALYHDADADALTLKMWDSSAGSATESSTIQTLVENTTDLTGQYGFSGSVRHSDGHLIVAAISERDTGTSDHQVFDINGTASITSLTAITTNIDDHYYPAVFIDQNTDDLFVAFNGIRTGADTLGTTSKVYYTSSSDNGSNWSAGSTAYQEGAASLNVQVWAPLMGPRFYVGWRVGTTLIGNKVNSLTFSGGPTDVVGTDSFTLSESSSTVGQAVGVDTFTLSETSAIALLIGSAVDVFTLTEAAIAQSGGNNLVAVETITLSDSLVAVVLASPTDTATLTDALTELTLDFPNTTEIFTLSEASVAVVNVVATDSATLTDLASLASGNNLSAADAFILSESATATLVAVALDALSLTDTVETLGALSLVDTLTFSEATDTGGTILTGIARFSSITIRPRIEVHPSAGADSQVTWGDTAVLMGSELVTFGGGYLGELPDGTGISSAMDAEVEVGV